VDVFPTLCDLLSIAPPAWLQGRSLMPLVRGETEEVNEAIYGEVTYHAAYEPQRCVRTRRYKYIRRYGARRTPVRPNCDDSPSKDLWLAHGWAERELPREALYDVVWDPNEAHNLAGDPAAAEALAEMRARLDAWMAATDDPLLRGEVPVPAGARINDADGVSPREPLR
jgi:arylsulfatase A-like enzyme